MDIDYKFAYDVLITETIVKSAEETLGILHSVLQSPTRIVNTIHHWEIISAPFFASKFDLITKIYQMIEKYQSYQKTNMRFISFYNFLEEPGELKNLLLTKKEMIFLLFGVVWSKAFLLQECQLCLLKCINLIKAADCYRETILQWLLQTPASYMTTAISKLHDLLTMQFEKLASNITQVQLSRRLKINIANINHFLKLLYESNNNNERVPQQIFNLKSIRQYFVIIDQFKLHLQKIQELNFIRYPFLLEFQYKYQLLKIQSAFEQRQNMQLGLNSLLHGMFNFDGEISLQGILFLHFSVSRNNLLNDSMEKLNHVKRNLKNPLRISFIGEEGADEGGVTKEFFQLITKEIFNPYLDMFIPKNKDRFYWFNGFSYEPPIRFEFVGMLLGLALYNNVQLKTQFPLILYKKLLNKNKEEFASLKTIQDLKEIEPQICDSLQKILKMEDSFQDLSLFFTVELINFGQTIVKDLVEGGSQIPLTKDNKMEYCLCMADFFLHRHIEKQFRAFQNGFFRVVTGQMIDLQKIICGSETIDFEQLEQSARYEGYTCESEYIKGFWKILKQWKIEDKKKFLTFVTGTDRVPIEGLKKVRLVVQRHANTLLLPVAHTCFNVLQLPQYSSIVELQQKLQIVLENNQGFGLL